MGSSEGSGANDGQPSAEQPASAIVQDLLCARIEVDAGTSSSLKARTYLGNKGKRTPQS